MGIILRHILGRWVVKTVGGCNWLRIMSHGRLLCQQCWSSIYTSQIKFNSHQ